MLESSVRGRQRSHPNPPGLVDTLRSMCNRCHKRGPPDHLRRRQARQYDAQHRLPSAEQFGLRSRRHPRRRPRSCRSAPIRAERQRSRAQDQALARHRHPHRRSGQSLFGHARQCGPVGSRGARLHDLHGVRRQSCRLRGASPRGFSSAASRRRDRRVASTPHSDHLLLRLAEQSLPVVLIGRRIDHPRVDAISANFRHGGVLATQHLLGIGHRRIAFLCA
jgi:Periplasmic binding proteins and sugar binding domain of LacI family